MSDAGRARWLGAWLLYLWLAVPALLGALPLGLLVGGLWGHHPGGDTLLWEAGGFHLLETARLLGRDVGALAWAAPWLLLGWSLLGVLPQALVLASLDDEGEAPGERLARALAAISPLVLVLGVALLARVALLLLCLGAARLLEPGLAVGPGRDAGHAVVAAVAVALTSLARVFHDLAAAAVVRRRERGSAALITGLETLHRRFGAAAGAWAARALASLAALGLAAAVGSLWNVGLGVALAVVVHQLGLLAAARLRVGWLGRALELTAPRDVG